MEDQIWKPVPGYEGRYEVSDHGNVLSLLVHPGPDKPYHKQHFKFGYPKVLLFKNKRVKWFFVHRLVWIAFRGPVPAGLVVNHIDHNKANPRLENLEAVSQEENLRQSAARNGHPSTRLAAKRRAAVCA